MGLIKDLLKALGWNAFCVVCGLAQLAILYLISFFSDFSFNIDKFLIDGVILFFCSSFVTFSIIEYLFLEIRFHKNVEFWLIWLIPILIIVIVITAYCVQILAPEKINLEKLRLVTFTCFIISVTNSVIYRTILFNEKLKLLLSSNIKEQ
ncbi:MAG: hypothetical protein FWG98_08295 [Candidatus Cloacimonetes bacterium]|nr:hypothetical protein [Candidatus Cloacimonadota bacterium]